MSRDPDYHASLREGSAGEPLLLARTNQSEAQAPSEKELSGAPKPGLPEAEEERHTACEEVASLFQLGSILNGRFSIVRFLARGGMGEVYEVRDHMLQDVSIALKIVLPHIASDPESRRRFQKEVLLAREISHPNLCPIYDIFQCTEHTPHFAFLTMKLLHGEPLSARLAGSRPLPVSDALSIEQQLISGVRAIHEAGVVHRDLKPNNVIVDGRGKALHLWITDFGLAGIFETDATLQTRALAGTPGYLAPELLLGQVPSPATDLFALGVLLHEVFTGERPSLKPGSLTPVVNRKLELSGLPERSVALVRALLADDPGRRCTVFREVSEPFTANQETHAGAASPTVRRRTFLGLGTAAAVSLAAAMTWEREAIETIFHPLPLKRFVAVLAWPRTAESHLAGLLSGVVDALELELSRAEAFDHNFSVTVPEKAGGDTRDQLRAVRDSVGANLVLAISAQRRGDETACLLSLLDPDAAGPLRQKEVMCAAGQEPSLPHRAVHAAARLLDVREEYLAGGPPASTTTSPAAYAALQAGDSLRVVENDAGLEQAISKYREATELDPRYALAYAKIALAYGRLGVIRRDASAFALAERNYDTALTLMPTLADGYLAKALVLQQTGDALGALRTLGRGLSVDPTNYRLLHEQAALYGSLNRWQESEQTFARVLKQRPNYWETYNELGAVYSDQGKYKEALAMFRVASLGAPRVTLEFNNIASVYLALGNIKEALENAAKSLALAPNALAAGTMAAGQRMAKNYDQALVSAKSCVALDPSDPTGWLELGDCYSSIRRGSTPALTAYRKASAVQQDGLTTNPEDGPGWVLLALTSALSREIPAAVAALRRGDALPSDAMDTQLYKARALEALGRRDEALSVVARCLQRGATHYEIDGMAPDMDAFRKDPRYGALVDHA